MSDAIPINPIVLRWARETAGFSIDDVVLKINRKRVSAKTIEAWEKGGESPNYSQLERLAYEIYKRPLALFFFPEPPDEESPKQSFRTLPELELSKLSPRMRFLIRQARAMQINLRELNDNINPASNNILKELGINPDIDVKKMSILVRNFIDINLATQTSWKDNNWAFNVWRTALENHGIFVFKEAFKEDSFSGFCLYDIEFPIIYINNSKPYTRQIFTLFHELAHLLLGTGGVDTRIENYIRYLRGDSRKIEILCNKFAGEFLVPEDDFILHVSDISISDEIFSKLADRYHVSREVILRKFLDRKTITIQFYEDKAEQWAQVIPKSGGGGDYYRTKGAYLGTRYLEMAFSRYYQKRISAEQLANYLGVKVKFVGGMESLLYNKGAAD